MSYSAPCTIPGCIDLNKNLSDAIRERATNYPDDCKAPLWHQEGEMPAHDTALFYLHPFDNYVMGPVSQIECGCEIRGGGNLISPLHIHHCPKHSIKE